MMVKRHLFLVFFFLSVSCTKGSDSVLDLLRNGDPKVCVDHEVIERVLASVAPLKRWPRGPESSKYPNAGLLIGTATAETIKKDERSVACAASFGLTLDGSAVQAANSINVDFEVQPDLANEKEFVIRTRDDSAREQAKSMLQAYGIVSLKG